VDTVTHILVHEFMSRIHEIGWEKWSEMAEHIYQILAFTQEKSKNYVIFSLIEKGENDEIRTLGKLLKEKIDIPSLFTIVLKAECVAEENEDSKVSYHFRTQPNTTDEIYKAPPGMFEFVESNDLDVIIKKAKKYYYG